LIPATGYTAVIPGWHTTLFGPELAKSLFVGGFMALSACLYLLAARKGWRVNVFVFVLHVICSVPDVVLCKFPVLLVSLLTTWQPRVESGLAIVVSIFAASFTLFLIGQFAFLVYMIRAARIRRRKSLHS